MFRLVCSGQATPGQTGWQVLDAMSFDVLTDFAYGMLQEHRDTDERRKVDEMLERAAEVARPSDTVPVKRGDGTVVHITEARLAQIRRNMGGMGRIARGKRKEAKR